MKNFKKITLCIIVLLAFSLASCDLLGGLGGGGETTLTTVGSSENETEKGEVTTDAVTDGNNTEESSAFVNEVTSESELVTEIETVTETEIKKETETETDSLTETETETDCPHNRLEKVEVIAPTCQSGGILHVVCSDCGEIVMDGEVESLPHTEGSWIIEKMPTLEKNGLKTTSCTVCGEQIKKAIDKVGYAEGLGFLPNGDGTCSLESIGNCKEIFVFVPPTSPDGDIVVSVGEGAFSDFYTDCDIVSLTLPDSVEIIGNSAFEGLTKLKEVTLPKGLKVIGDFAFGSCFSLESVTIPEGVTDIGNSAFTNCHGIKKWNIPASVERIGRAAFFPEKITEITVDPENQNFYVEGNCLISSDGVLIMGYGDVSIPDGVKIIGKEAFAYNNKISKIILPESVESIEFLAFYNCSVTEIVIPEGVTRLSDSFCSFCDELKSVTIPKSVTEIEQWAIDECPELSKIIYMGSLYDWNKINIHGDNELILSLDITFMEKSPVDAVRYYGRNTITGNAAYVYDMLASGVLADIPLERVELDEDKMVTLDDFSLGRMIFMSDHPECFWWGGTASYTHDDEGIIYSFDPVYTYSGDELVSMRAQLDSVVKEIVAGVPEGTIFEKALYLHDKVAEIVTYEFTDNDQTPYGALVEGRAVCNGYATSYQLLLMECGIRAWTVNGESRGIPHAWNVVWIDDETCVYTDVTWDDQDDLGVTLRYYFNMSLEEIDDDHTVNEFFTLPECNHTGESFIDVSTDLYLLTNDDGGDVLAGFFGEETEGQRTAHFFYTGADFGAWFENNSSQLYGALNCSALSYSITGNEIVMRAEIKE